MANAPRTSTGSIRARLRAGFLVVGLAAAPLFLATPPALAEDTKASDGAAGAADDGPKSGQVRIVKDVDEPPRADAPRPEAVGALAPPTAQELDPDPVRDGEKILTWLGFHSAKGYSRLFLKATERVAFEVTPGQGIIKVRIKQARAKLSNNMRFLDMSYFPTALWRVTPRRAGDDVDVEILMREVVAYKLRRKGDTIQIDFDLPAKK